MTYGAPRAQQDWEWREDEYRQRRQRAKQRALRRGRLRLAAFVVATIVVIASALLASRAISIPSPYARASLATVGEKTRGSVAVLASKDDNEETSEARGIPSVVTWEDGVSIVSSSVSDGALFSTATVSITHIDMLDGLIVADSMDLVASAAATEHAVSGGVDVSRVEGLKVNGLDVELERLPLTIPGVGVLRALERRVVEEDNGLEAELVGLHLHLTSPWKALPEDADVIIGSAAACVDQESATRFLEQARAASGGDDDQDGSGGGSSDGGSSGAGSAGGGSAGGGSSGGGSAGGGSSGGSSSGDVSSAGSFRPGRMDKPSRPDGDLLSFPGAVFPVDGPVWYGDDFGAPRAVGGGHTGNDIFARRGTPVVAVQAGTVTELRYRSLGGNSFHLDNDRGDYFYYAHLLRYAAGIQEGSYVEAGQVLGYVGNTGNAISTPPHLHFEIHPAAGPPIDPYPYLELWRGEAALAAEGSGEAAKAAPSPSPAAGARAISADAERGRHEQTVLVAGVPAPREVTDLGAGMLVPAAVSFGVLGGLVTSAARRRRVAFALVTMEPEALHRAARAE